MSKILIKPFCVVKDFPYFCESGSFSEQFDFAEPYVLLREHPSETDSGWRIVHKEEYDRFCTNTGKTNIAINTPYNMSLYQIFTYLPRFSMFFALPPGAVITIWPESTYLTDAIDVKCGNTSINSNDNAFLRRFVESLKDTTTV